MKTIQIVHTQKNTAVSLPELSPAGLKTHIENVLGIMTVKLKKKHCCTMVCALNKKTNVFTGNEQY